MLINFRLEYPPHVISAARVVWLWATYLNCNNVLLLFIRDPPLSRWNSFLWRWKPVHGRRAPGSQGSPCCSTEPKVGDYTETAAAWNLIVYHLYVSSPPQGHSCGVSWVHQGEYQGAGVQTGAAQKITKCWRVATATGRGRGTPTSSNSSHYCPSKWTIQ